MLKTKETTFVDHVSFDRDTQYGPRVSHTFTDSDGEEFQILTSARGKSLDVATALYNSINTPVTIQYEEKQNGEYLNRNIKEVETSVTETTPIPSTNGNAPSTTASGNKEQRITRLATVNQALTAMELAYSLLDEEDRTFEAVVETAETLLTRATFISSVAYNFAYGDENA